MQNANTKLLAASGEHRGDVHPAATSTAVFEFCILNFAFELLASRRR
jgi:hypothetical protein